MIKFLHLGKKKPEETKLGKGFIPVDRVRELSGKGFSEPEIIDVLRKEGFSAEEIDRALTQALKIGATGEPEASTQLPTLEDITAAERPKENETALEVPERSLQYPQYPEEYGAEEMVESIVQERMGEVDQKISEIKMKHSELEREISNLHHQLSIITKGRSQVEQTIISKIDSLKDSVNDMDGRLSSLEKAFKDALPALIESVRSLTDLVQRLKKES